MIQGTYNFEDNIKIDCNNAYAHFNVYAHELAHWTLNKNTFFGILIFLVKNICEERRMQKLLGVVKVLCDSAERTNECFAICNELLFIESQRPFLYNDYYDELRKGVYYSKYQFEEIEFLVQSSSDIIEKNNLISRVFTLAMNIDISKHINEEYWSSNERLMEFFLSKDGMYYPDMRLKKILRALKELARDEDYYSITDQQIIEYSKIDVDEWTTDNITAFLERLKVQFENNNISTSLLEKNIDNIQENKIELGYNLPKDEEFERNIHLGILPDCLTQNYQYETFEYFDEIKSDISVITVYDEEQMALLELTDTRNGKIYSSIIIKDRIKVLHRLNNYPIVFYFDDVEVVKNYWKTILNKRIYFQLKNTYTDFKKLIEPYCSEKRYAFLYHLNHGVFFLFVSGNDDDIFFTCQSMINVEYVQEDFENGFFERVEFEENDCIDGIFCKNVDEWKIYYNIILYASKSKKGVGVQKEFFNRIMIY